MVAKRYTVVIGIQTIYGGGEGWKKIKEMLLWFGTFGPHLMEKLVFLESGVYFSIIFYKL